MGNEVEVASPQGGKMRARDIAVRPGSGISFTNAAEVMAYANMMADAGSAVPAHLRNSPGACLGVIDDSIRFGLSPFYCARQSYFVNDQLAYMAQLFAAVINAKLPLIKRPEYSYTGTVKRNGERSDGDLVCTVKLTLPGGEVIEHKSPPISDISRQKSPLWLVDPKQQLAYYTIRSATRLHFPDVLAGAYDIEEAAAFEAAQDVTPRNERGRRVTDISARLRGREGSNGDDTIRDNATDTDDSDRRDNGGPNGDHGDGQQQPGAEDHSDNRADEENAISRSGDDREDDRAADRPEILGQYEEALADCGSRNEVITVGGDFEEALAKESDETQAEASKLYAERLAEFPRKAKASAASAKL